MPDASAPAVGLVPTLVGFTRRLRDAGVALGTGDVLTYCAAAEPLDPTDLVDLYWAGRTTLVTRHDQIPVYDRVFRAYYLDQADEEDEPVPFSLQAKAGRSHGAPASGVPARRRARRAGGSARAGRLRRGDAQGQVVRRLYARGAGRAAPHHAHGAAHPAATAVAPHAGRARGSHPDPRRTVRASLRTHGDPTELWWRRRRTRLRPLVLILDVSGSMTDYSRSLLQFAYSARRAAARVEVFCFGTRLTRITRELEHRRPDEALARAAEVVVDWDGGTRIGDSLAAFVREWGRRGSSRGAIVVICSDGLDRGDPAVLDKALERLGRLSHRIVWLNPHKTGGADFRPSTLGMIVAAPHVDLLLSGHDLASLEEFAARLPDLG